MNTFLKNKDFRWITMSDWLSVIGDSIFYLALISFASSLSDSALAISLVTISETLPDALSFCSGYLCDKTSKKFTADIACAFIRAGIYFVVAILFAESSGWYLLCLVLLLNVVSDFLGCYSDNLRFPEIYAIVPDEEFESSNGFSSGIYYSFDVISKLLGGMVLIALKYDYTSFALINAGTFILCGLFMLHVKKSVQSKIESIEETLQEEDNVSLIGELVKLKRNKSTFSMILCFTITNAIIGCTNSILYVLLAKQLINQQEIYTIVLSIINAVSVGGIIMGNLIGDRLFKKRKIETLIKCELCSIILSIIAMLLGNIYMIIILFSLMFFIEGAMSIKFTSFLYNNQEYRSLGISAGIINSILTVLLPVALFIVSLLGNIFSFTISSFLVLSVAVLSFMWVSVKWK